MLERCIWSNRRDPGTREVKLESPNRFTGPETVQVCPAHEAQLRAFRAYSERYGGWFLALLGGLVLAALIAVVVEVEEKVIAWAVPTLVGSAMVVFPFATPQTVRMLGVHVSVLTVRIGGAALFGWGILQLARAS